jgi:hypothetical protein
MPSSQDKEEFTVANHEKATDLVLSEPQNPPFTQPIMFVSTLEASLKGLKKSTQELIKKFTLDGRAIDMAPGIKTLKTSLAHPKSKQPGVGTDVDFKGRDGQTVLTINCNFGHVACPEGKRYLKLKRREKKKNTNCKSRKLQGDGTCFNSTLEPVIRLGHNKAGKVYYMKCFTTTGQTQIPGTLELDASDGRRALAIWVSYLHSRGLPVEIEWSRVNMRNFKFALRRPSPRLIINLSGLFQHLRNVETIPGTPLKLLELKESHDNARLLFQARSATRKVRVIIFQYGKINFLGTDSFETKDIVFKFLSDLFAAHWNDFTILCPLPDAAESAVVTPPVKITFEIPKSNLVMTDEEFDSIFKETPEAKYDCSGAPTACVGAPTACIGAPTTGAVALSS